MMQKPLADIVIHLLAEASEFARIERDFLGRDIACIEPHSAQKNPGRHENYSFYGTIASVATDMSLRVKRLQANATQDQILSIISGYVPRKQLTGEAKQAYERFILGLYVAVCDPLTIESIKAGTIIDAPYRLSPLL